MDALPTLESARNALTRGSGKGVRVAILDSGVEWSSAGVAGAGVGDDIAFVESDRGIEIVAGEGRDLYGHGTAVCDIIHRLAPEAEIGSFRVLGSQLGSRSRVIREGVRHAIQRGYQILNCSFGCSREDHVLFYKDWIDEAYLHGRHVVAASNNLNFSKCEWPGHFPTVLTATFTQTKPDTFFYQKGSLVEFIALGQDVEVAWLSGQRKRVTGSSFAAPHIAGLLARLLSHYPQLPPLHAKALMHCLASPFQTNPSPNYQP